MAYLIHFSTPATPSVERYPNIQSARAAAEALETVGPRYVLTDITSKSLSVLTGSNIATLYTKLCDLPKTDPRRPKRNVAEMVDALITIIPERARDMSPGTSPKRSTKTMAKNENEVTAVAETPKAAKGAKKGAKGAKPAPASTKAAKGATKATKAAPAPAKGKKVSRVGRVSALAGQKLYLVKNSPFNAKMREGSRRSRSLSKIKDGILYEDALRAGAVKGDIDIMMKNGQLKTKK